MASPCSGTWRKRRYAAIAGRAPEPNPAVAALPKEVGHASVASEPPKKELVEGLFITKFRKIFCCDEMNDDLVLAPARQGDQEDRSEYEEILPTSPP